MPETVRLREDLGIVEVRSYGRVTVEDLILSREAVAELCQTHAITRVLVDAREETLMPSTAALLEFGGSLSRLDSLRPVKQAVVVSLATQDDVRIIQAAAMNRGAQIRIFESLEKAMAWLMS